MKVLHITPTSNGYEEVTLVANQIGPNNHLALIEKNGIRYITGGVIVEDCREIRETLDLTPKEIQYNFVLRFRNMPYVKQYATPEDLMPNSNLFPIGV